MNSALRYLTDAAGNRTAVIFDLADYQHILDELEELEDIRAFANAKACGAERVPLRQAIKDTGAGGTPPA